jgi:hypothetical protein
VTFLAQVKRRTDLEKEVQQLREEMSKLKKANVNVNSPSAAMRNPTANPRQSTIASSPTVDKHTSNNSNVANNKRKTRMLNQRATQRMSIHVVNTLDEVMKQIGGLDKKIRYNYDRTLSVEAVVL